MHRQFGSRFLIDLLHRQGFCISYDEVSNYEQSATSSGMSLPLVISENYFFMQAIADHNMLIITCKLSMETMFHGMGIIVAVTPRVDSTIVVKRNTKVSSKKLVKLASIEQVILPQLKPEVIFLDLNLSSSNRKNQTDNIWASSWFLNPKQPLYSGYMQMVSKGDHHGPTSIYFMPMIDQKSDVSCIASTLTFICNQASDYNKTPVVAFDQPLYWKAMKIQASLQPDNPIQKCVIRLDDFHRLTSFLGAIAHLMEGSGLCSVVELIYAELTVLRILNGKEVSRATRAHLIIYGTLMGLMLLKQLEIKKFQ